MKYRSLIASLVMLVSAPAFAEYLDEDAMLKNYTGVTNLLRVNGIEPSAIYWNEIEAMCAPLQDTDKLSYNRCRFEKARDQAIYRDDAAICTNESKVINPKSIGTGTVVTNTFNGSEVVSTPVITSVPAVADIHAYRRYVFDHCMMEKGWRNARNYRLGLAN